MPLRRSAEAEKVRLFQRFSPHEIAFPNRTTGCGTLCHSCGGSPTKRSRRSASERIINFISMSLTRKTESKFQRLFKPRKRHIIQRQTNAQPARGVIELPDQNMSLAQSGINPECICVFNEGKQRRSANFFQTGVFKYSRQFLPSQTNTYA